MTLLIVGGTGTLGRQIVRKALEDGFQVRCIVRNKRTANFLKEWGAELVYGDLTIPETLPLSFQGVTAVIDVSTTRSEDDAKMVDVDWYGKLMLIEMAKRVNVKRFIFFSIVNADQYSSITLMQQKANIEKVLKNSGVPYTIFQCAGFYQALISQYAIPILEGKSVWKTSETLSMSYIDTQDAAKFCIKSLSLKETENKSFFLGGPKAWTSDEIIILCEKLSGQKAEIKKIPIGLLNLLRQVTGFFEWTSKISERLAFAQLLQDDRQFLKSTELNSQVFQIKPTDLLSLEAYLREYFEMMLVTLENLDIKSQKNQKDLII
jgi:uncharacterized protein YbjT (DUF2867 family)